MIEVSYKENGKFEVISIYGMNNFFTWLDENKMYVEIITIKTI